MGPHGCQVSLRFDECSPVWRVHPLVLRTVEPSYGLYSYTLHPLVLRTVEPSYGLYSYTLPPLVRRNLKKSTRTYCAPPKVATAQIPLCASSQHISAHAPTFLCKAKYMRMKRQRSIKKADKKRWFYAPRCTMPLMGSCSVSHRARPKAWMIGRGQRPG